MLLFVLSLARRIGVFGYVNFFNLPDVVDVTVALARDYLEIGNNLVVSFIRVIQGFLIGSVLGIIAGIMSSMNKIASMIINPIMDALRPIPNAAWLPIAILIFTRADISMIFILVMSSIFPVYVNTRYGILKLDKEYLELAQILKLSQTQKIYEIVIKGALYDIFVGLQLGMSGAWLAVIVAEMVSGKSGIGYYIWLNYTLLNVDKVFAGVLIISICGILSCKIVSTIGRALIKWREN